VELLVWTAARRLAWLVGGALLVVAVPFVLEGRIGVLSALTGGLATALLGAALIPLLRARGLLRQAAAPDAPPPASLAYRASAAARDREPLELQATHLGAVALLMLALAAAFVVVAAASR
jgi:hypothetical protein